MRRRDERQKKVADWGTAAFGEGAASSIPQRGIRLLEEALETYQACGCDEAMAHRLVEYVFQRPVGDLANEIGGVSITVLALSQAAGVSADREELRELGRILSKPIEYFRARNAAKNAAGFEAAANGTLAERGMALIAGWTKEQIDAFNALTPADVKQLLKPDPRLCSVCFTISWEPCEGGERCGYCWLSEQCAAHREALGRFLVTVSPTGFDHMKAEEAFEAALQCVVADRDVREHLTDVSQKWLNAASERDELLPIKAERNQLRELLAQAEELRVLAKEREELRSQLARFANPWTVEILNQKSNQWSDFCHDAPLTLADAEERERVLKAENPDAKFRVVPWLNSSQRAQLSTTREIARELLTALKVQHKNCLYCKHYPSQGCIAVYILAKVTGLLDDRSADVGALRAEPGAVSSQNDERRSQGAVTLEGEE